MSIATDLGATPQSLFGVSRAVRIGDVNRMTMTLGEGEASTAALGVLVDDILGFTLYHRRGDRDGLVSATLSVDYARPTGWHGPHLTADGTVETLDRDGGLASARIVDGAGALIARATLWGSFVDGVTQTRPIATEITPAPLPAGVAGPIEALCGTLESTEAGARLTVPPNPVLANAIGSMHGGILTCAHDVAATAAAGSSMRTASLTVNFFTPVLVDAATVFDATVLRAGHRVCVVRVSALSSSGRECSTATVTLRRNPDDAASC
ncbi:PaaI family thioesterase [Rhodococcus gannanensis]|uniref:PaaI family thioesterase n=1 Tax=Rhodococcus gannanensis TaxID=1960308 RepID=A0ABW4P5L3_9NOCA